MAVFILFSLIYKNEKRGASLMLVPRCKGLRISQIVETSNTESPT